MRIEKLVNRGGRRNGGYQQQQTRMVHGDPTTVWVRPSLQDRPAASWAAVATGTRPSGGVIRMQIACAQPHPPKCRRDYTVSLSGRRGNCVDHSSWPLSSLAVHASAQCESSRPATAVRLCLCSIERYARRARCMRTSVSACVCVPCKIVYDKSIFTKHLSARRTRSCNTAEYHQSC